jgi:cob(I)alamin adenosyltransferase
MTGTSDGNAFRGYIQVYTGNGKGKTTAALGLAFRAAGHGMRTYFGQFLKGQDYGEIEAAAKLSPLIRIERFGKRGFIHVTEGPDDEDLRRAREGLEKCREAMLSGEFRIVVLDEVLTAVLLKVLAEEDVLAFLEGKPDGVEIVLTGRGASPAVIDRADLVTEMKDVKHYFDKGVRARTGIER